MDTLVTTPADLHASSDVAREANTSAVSWPAIIAGAVVAAGASLILLALGSGIGLASVSPWPGSGASATSFTALTAIWLVVVIGAFIAGVAAAMGGRARDTHP